MNRQATVFVLLALITALLLFGKNKAPRAFGALWGPPSAPDASMAGDAQAIVKGSLGFGVAAIITLALADTAAYPLMLGILIVALLFLLFYGGGLKAVAYADQLLTTKPAQPAPAQAAAQAPPNTPRAS